MNQGNEVVMQALDFARKAEELKGEAIKQLLSQREQIERDLKILGYVPGQQSVTGKNGDALHGAVEKAVEALRPSKRFRGLTLAQAARQLLLEHGKLHGKKIEELAKLGGFKGGTANFQNYMPVALKRDGGFENIGGNTWRLKQPQESA